ncbi:MAG: TonB family protein [Bacteroidota bacterium]
MLDLIADIGRSSAGALWVPILVWTALAALTEAGLRVFRAPPDLGLPLRGATLAALPAAVALPSVLGALAPDAAGVVAAVAPVAIVTLPEIVVGAAPEVAPAASGPPALDVLLGIGVVGVVLAAVVALVRLGVAVVATRRSTRRLAPASEAVQRRLDAMCARLGVVRSVRAVVAPPETPPFTVGWRRPVVAVPSGLAGDVLDLALLHEAAHVERADAAWHVAQRTVAALFAAHPLVRVLARGLDLDRERAADAAVLIAHPGHRRTYADLLFSFASAPPPPLAIGAMSGASILKTRLDAMTHLSSPLRRAWMARAGRLGGALTLVVALGLTLSVSAQAPPPPPPPPPPPSFDDAQEWVRFADTDGEREVIVQLRANQSRDDAEAVADRYHEPGAPGRVEIRYRGGVIEREGVNMQAIQPPPPPPAPASPPPPPPPGVGGDTSDQMASDQTTRRVEGLVFDADTRDALVGANVLVMGTTVGAATGPDGRFRMNAPEGEQVVRVVSTGYEERTVRLGADQSELNVALTVSNTAPPAVDRPRGAPAQGPSPQAPEIFEVAEVQPQLIGGLPGLQSRIVYPAEAREAGVEGVVVIQFVVNEQGRVTDPRILRSPDGRLSEAALAAVRASEFEPGMQRGQPVKVRFAVPVTFRLPGSEAEDQGNAAPVPDKRVWYAGIDLDRLTPGSRRAFTSTLNGLTEILDRHGAETGDIEVEYVVDSSGNVVSTEIPAGHDLGQMAAFLLGTVQAAEDARPGTTWAGTFRLWYRQPS